MATPAFPATNPVTQPAVPAIVWDHWALNYFNAQGTGIGNDIATVRYSFAQAGFDANGVEVLNQNSNSQLVIVQNVYALAATEPLIGVALQMLCAALLADATGRNIGIGNTPAGHLTSMLNTVVAELQAIIPGLNGA